MPHGNATFVYKGEHPQCEVQGQVFPVGQPRHVVDNGIICALSDREDFAEITAAAPAPKPPSAPAVTPKARAKRATGK